MSEQVAPPPASNAEQPQPAIQAPPPAETRKSGGRKALGIIGAIVAILVVAGLKFGVGSAIGGFLNSDETAEAKAGDCIAQLPEVTGDEQESVSNAEVVECTSTKAAYQVVGRVEGQTEAQARTGEACEQYLKEGEEAYVFSAIKPGGTGYLLCLTKKA